MANKNTETVCDFYSSKLVEPKSLKNKNICLLALGNIKYELECKKNAKSALILHDCNSDDPFGGINFEDINSLKERIENWLEIHKMKKFDLIVMNPPYDGSLHLKILEAVIPFAKKTVNISPNIFLKYKIPEKCWKMSTFMNAYLQKVDILPYEMNFLFDIGNSIAGLCIYTFGEKGKLKIDDVMYKNDIEKSLFEKIFKKRKNKLGWENKYTKRHGEQLGYFVNLYTWHSGKDAYSTCIREDDKFTRTVYFASETQKINFKNSFKTIFMNFYCKEIVLKGNGITDKCFMFERELYNQPWTDKRFCEYFNITGYISDSEAEPGSEWEMILNVVKDK